MPLSGEETATVLPDEEVAHGKDVVNMGLE